METPYEMDIALGNKARVGKDTIASYIASRAPYDIISFAAPLYSIARAVQEICGRPVEKDPALLQLLGEQLRRLYGGDLWINIALREIQRSRAAQRRVIVTDMRYRAEMAALKALGFLTLRVCREDRPIDRDPTHISEVDLDECEFDHHVDNNGTIEELRARVDEILGWRA